MVNKKESNRAKRDRLIKEYKSLSNGFVNLNKRDKNSNNSKRIQTAYNNSITKKEKLAFQKDAFRESMNYNWEKVKQKDRVITLAEKKEARLANDKMLRAQERQKEYKQKRKEYISKSISDALESWKFKF